jgi:hypothetical protein
VLNATGGADRLISMGTYYNLWLFEVEHPLEGSNGRIDALYHR